MILLSYCGVSSLSDAAWLFLMSPSKKLIRTQKIELVKRETAVYKSDKTYMVNLHLNRSVFSYFYFTFNHTVFHSCLYNIQVLNPLFITSHSAVIKASCALIYN